jgi:hypothetical protein
MWKLIKGTFSVTKEALSLAGEGLVALNHVLEEVNTGLQDFNEEMDVNLALSNVQFWIRFLNTQKGKTPSHFTEVQDLYDRQLALFDKVIIVLEMSKSDHELRKELTEAIHQFKHSMTPIVNDLRKTTMKPYFDRGLSKHSSLKEMIIFYCNNTPISEIRTEIIGLVSDGILAKIGSADEIFSRLISRRQTTITRK